MFRGVEEGSSGFLVGTLKNLFVSRAKPTIYWPLPIKKK